MPLTFPSHSRRVVMRRWWSMEKGTVVVIDDEPNIADLVELYLSREGFRVVKAATGRGGLEAARDK